MVWLRGYKTRIIFRTVNYGKYLYNCGKILRLLDLFPPKFPNIPVFGFL